jgi:cytochrome c oxidase subunit II
LADAKSNPMFQPLADGVVPAEVVARTEKRWLQLMFAMLVLMLVIVVLTSAVAALHPASNVEVIQPATLHLGGEFAETNLGTAIEPDGSATVRLIA